jgi:hypothetical protein
MVLPSKNWRKSTPTLLKNLHLSYIPLKVKFNNKIIKKTKNIKNIKKN